MLFAFPHVRCGYLNLAGRRWQTMAPIWVLALEVEFVSIESCFWYL
jgi:hypothetical protein